MIYNRVTDTVPFSRPVCLEKRPLIPYSFAPHTNAGDGDDI